MGLHVYIWQCVCFHAPLHLFHPLLLPPAHVHKSVLYICISIAALQIGSSVPSFQIPYICVKTYLLNSVIGSRFIYLLRSDPNVFFFIPLYMCTCVCCTCVHGYVVHLYMYTCVSHHTCVHVHVAHVNSIVHAYMCMCVHVYCTCVHVLCMCTCVFHYTCVPQLQSP